MLRLLSLSLLLAASAVAHAAPPRTSDLDFDRTVAPVLAANCLDCHSGPKPKGKLDLSHRSSARKGGRHGAALVAGKPEASRLWQFVESDKMPPKKPLSSADKKLLQRWITAGARWGSDPIDPFRFTTGRRAGLDWWALQPVRRPALPTVHDAGWLRNPIDAFVLRRLEDKGLRPASMADRRTLIRRLSFDLLGLPPSPEEVAAFIHDPSSDAYERLVDRYLASPAYGVRWARHWLDVARFGESNGFEFNEFRPHAWPYRDWVVNAFNRDLPYDEFVRLQLAGDVLRPRDPSAIEATGFLVAGAYDSPGQSQQSLAMRRVVRQDELEDIVGTVGQTFLGLTVNCARCHDHKFDPIRQVEYYRLTAALAGVHHGERDLTNLDPRAMATRRQLAAWQAQLNALETPVRQRIQAQSPKTARTAPTPLASWDFRRGLKDRHGHLEVAIHGHAQRTSKGLHVGGDGYGSVRLLGHDFQAKTLEAWVQLDNLQQRGGGVLSLDRSDGVFDALVFGELEPGHWMAGSDNFVRTQSFHGPTETAAPQKTIHVAITYAPDGTVTGYRNGQVYGQPFRVAFPAAFQSGKTRILFGLRHSEPISNRVLTGTIVRANLYDRALTPDEVAASAGTVSQYVSPAAVQAHFTPVQKACWQLLYAQIEAGKARLASLSEKIYAVTPQPPETAHLLLRGNPAQPAQVVSAGGVAAVKGVRADFGLSPDAPEAERRLRLAAWITDPHNPLTARVIANRLWQYHFGTGLVRTPNDFGFNGGRPSHPQLLDWLASELVAHRWSLKRIQRLIVLSTTYRESGRISERAMQMDASNRFLWRHEPHRLEAETTRDAILQVSGQLNLRMGGPSFQDFRATQAPGTAAMFYTPADPVGPEFNRRTLYRSWARGSHNALLDVLDCPDPSATAPHRTVTTTPLQALALLNDRFMLRMADRFAERLAREAGANVDRQIDRAYVIAYGRLPSMDEHKLARQAVRQYGLAVLARAIFNSNEFLYVD